jgi:hypothetical protein
MATLQTIAKGVYVVKPDMQATNATDYVEMYTKARSTQLEIALQEALRQDKQKQLEYQEQMRLYTAQYEALQKRKQDLISAQQAGILDAEKYNATKRNEIELQNAKIAADREERKAEQQVLTAPRLVRESEGTGGGAGKEKLTPEEEAALKSIRGPEGDFVIPKGSNFSRALAEKTNSAIAGQAVLGATSPAKAMRIRAGAVQEAINQKMQQGLSEAAAQDMVARELGGEAMKPFRDAWNELYGDKTDTDKPRFEGGSYQRPKYKGLGEAPQVEFQPMETAGSLDFTQKELDRLQKELDALQIPKPEQIDILERARQIRQQKFRGPVVEESRIVPTPEDIRFVTEKFEMTPQGYVATRVSRGKKLLASPDELESLLGSDIGKSAQKIFEANKATTKSSQEAMKKSWDELSKIENLEDKRKAHEILIALNEKAAAMTKPEKAVQIEAAVAAPPPVQEAKPVLDLGETEVIGQKEPKPGELKPVDLSSIEKFYK